MQAFQSRHEKAAAQMTVIAQTLLLERDGAFFAQVAQRQGKASYPSPARAKSPAPAYLDFARKAHLIELPYERVEKCTRCGAVVYHHALRVEARTWLEQGNLRRAQSHRMAADL